MKKIPSIIVALLFIFTAFSALLIVPNSNACSYCDRETTKKQYCFNVAFEDLQDNTNGEENYNDWDYNDCVINFNIDLFGDAEDVMGYLSMEKIIINMTMVSKLASYNHGFWLMMPKFWANWELSWKDGENNILDGNGDFPNTGKLWSSSYREDNINDILIFESSQDANEVDLKATLTLTPRCPYINFLIFKYVFPFTFIEDDNDCPYTFWGEEQSNNMFSSAIPGSFFQPYLHIKSVDRTIPPTINDPDDWWVKSTPDIRVFFIDMCDWTPPSDGQCLCSIDEYDCIYCGPCNEPTFEEPE